MKRKTTKTKETGSLALPGNPISLEEFKAGIKEAEKSPFYTIEESSWINFPIILLFQYLKPLPV